MIKKIETEKLPILIWTNDVEEEAIKQLKGLANLPIVFHHVAAMPDVHAGKGSTIGTVLATDRAIIPAAIGVDIGCGMSALRFPFQVDSLKNLKELRHSIERSIPTGRNVHRTLTDRIKASHKALGLPATIKESSKLYKNSLWQLGTLGGGNHFIEICLDLEDTVWVLLHSGSRHIGKELADKHIEIAKHCMGDKINDLPDSDLAYLIEDTPEFLAYITDMNWCQNYAKANRKEMVLRVVKDLSYHVYQDERLVDNFESYFFVDCHHNYSQQENHFGKTMWITRKGAVSARQGEYGIIPGSMGAKSFIVCGKGDEYSFSSCSHGAGRKMSRTAARQKFKEEDIERETKGIECRKDRGILDELPSAYKSIDEVMENQKDLTSAIHQLRQIICIKG